jgi:hypothetical protein
MRVDMKIRVLPASVVLHHVARCHRQGEPRDLVANKHREEFLFHRKVESVRLGVLSLSLALYLVQKPDPNTVAWVLRRTFMTLELDTHWLNHNEHSRQDARD